MPLNPRKYMAEPGNGWNWRAIVPGASLLKDGLAKYPKQFSGLIPGSEWGDYLVASGVGAALLGVALMGGARGFKWLVDAGREDTDSDPAKKMREQLGTTFTYGEQANGTRKTAADATVPYGTVERPSGVAGIFKSTANVAVPALALILAGGAAFKGIDALADAAWTRRTEKNLARNQETLRKLIAVRARLAKGNASDEEVESALADAASSGYVKRAFDLSDFKSALGSGAERLGVAVLLLTIGAGITSGVGAYRYFKKSDPGNIKYKAYERGLQDYARLKTQMTPLTISPDRELLDSIDDGPSGNAGTGDVRGMSEVAPTRRPITLTVD